MATQSTYYLNAPSLSSATAVFTDASLTTCAPDGLYSDGTVVRELSGCVLLPIQYCPSCTGSIPCGSTPVSTTVGQGVYDITYELGAGTGTVIVDVNPFVNPIDAVMGYQVEYDGNIYNEFSSQVFGYLAGPAGTATYMGYYLSDCSILANQPYTLPLYSWDGTSFVNQSSPQSISVVSGQINTTAGAPEICRLAFYKSNASPSTMKVRVIGACTSGSVKVSATCPALLDAFECGMDQYDTDTLACDAIPVIGTYYSVPVNGSAGVVGLYDWIYVNSAGSIKLADSLGAGYYRLSGNPNGDWMYIDGNSVVTSFGYCSGPL